MVTDYEVLINESIKGPSFFEKVDGVHPRVQAKRLDRTLGYRIPKVEMKLLQKYRAYDQCVDDSNKKQHYEGAQVWIGLHPQVLQTPYSSLLEVFSLLKTVNVKRVVDIGAGYGRVGIVMKSIFPDAEFIGYEILQKRKNEGNRIFDSLGLLNCKLYLQDVLQDDFKLPKAEVYFIYDFSEADHIAMILDQLSQRFNSYNFFLITKGERVNDLIEKEYSVFWKKNGYLSSNELKIYSSIVDLQNFIE